MFLQGSMSAAAASVASYSGLFSIPALADQTNYPVLFDAVSAKKLRPKLTKEDF